MKTWNDPAIQKLNPSAKLPSQPIVVVHRSDGSGTTFIFTDYLSKVSADWKSKVGANTSVEWPVGIGAKGNEGVANNVAKTKGSIGYVEYAYAKQNKLTYTKHDQQGRQDGRADRKVVSGRCRQRRLGKGTPGFGVILTNEPGAKSWPHRRRDLHPDAQAAAGCSLAAGEALKFFAWAYAKGDKMAEELDYVPMPDKVVSAIKKSWIDADQGQGRQASLRDHSN